MHAPACTGVAQGHRMHLWEAFSQCAEWTKQSGSDVFLPSLCSCFINVLTATSGAIRETQRESVHKKNGAMWLKTGQLVLPWALGMLLPHEIQAAINKCICFVCKLVTLTSPPTPFHTQCYCLWFIIQCVQAFCANVFIKRLQSWGCAGYQTVRVRQWGNNQILQISFLSESTAFHAAVAEKPQVLILYSKTTESAVCTATWDP